MNICQQSGFHYCSTCGTALPDEANLRERLQFAGDTCRELQYRVVELERQLAVQSQLAESRLEALAELQIRIQRLEQTTWHQHTDECYGMVSGHRLLLCDKDKP